MANMNPFEITKAVDFSDEQIKTTFVNYPQGGFEAFMSPASPMARFLVGGKGGGRTHLMRFYSYALRKPADGTIIDGVREDRYIGIYFRCSGLNASRFRGKHIEPHAWTALFSFYMDVWLTEHLLTILRDIDDRDGSWSPPAQLNFASEVVEVLAIHASDIPAYPLQESVSIADLCRGFAEYRKFMDRSINNAAISGTLEIPILSTPGQLLFAATRAAHDELPGLDGVMFTFLIDEYENLSADQQTYVNTLIREKELPTSFLIGSRRYGLKTQRTLSANEENKRGSEFELEELEDTYQRTQGTYPTFCIELALRRLSAAGYPNVSSEKDLHRIFSSRRGLEKDRLGDTIALSLLSKSEPDSRKYIRRLYENILTTTKSNDFATQVTRVISRPTSPMSEKLAIHRFYQNWAQQGGPSVEIAQDAAQEMDSLRDGSASPRTSNFLRLWKADLLAQIYLDCDRHAPYLGIERFIDLSGYLPRSFLTTMKYVTQAALLRGEKPFDISGAVSAESQVAGVLDASQWFLRDARPTEGLGGECEQAIRRLATFFNRSRYSDKPVEVSCVAFSTDFYDVPDRVVDVLTTCASHSLLIEVPRGRVARNEGSKWHKYQLHPMLAPSFALPTSRRGEMQFSALEISAIFDPEVSDRDYAAIMRTRLKSMYAPFKDTPPPDPSQRGLF